MIAFVTFKDVQCILVAQEADKLIYIKIEGPETLELLDGMRWDL